MSSLQDVRGVPVDGGEIAVEMRSGTSEAVLAVHGISSTRKLWNWLRSEAPDLTLIAPDLRGRGDSVGVKGTAGISRHTDDLVAVLDDLRLGAVHVCGMSMGGFVAVDLAGRHPDRVKSLVLVDGGPPMAAPAGLRPDTLPAVFADRLGRLEQIWPSLDEYAAFFTRTTAPLLDPADPLLRDYLAHDLDEGKVRLSGQALLEDAEDVFFGDSRWEGIPAQTWLLYAEWGAGPGSPPAYSHAAVDAWRPRLAGTRYLPGLDHAGSIMTKTGAVAAAELLHEALA